MTHLKQVLALALCFPVMVFSTQPAYAAAPAQLLSDAVGTLDTLADPGRGTDLAAAIRAGHGVVIVPRLLRAGLMIGGNGGNGVLLARNAETGRFGNPVFVELTGASLGLQVGAETMQTVIVLKTEAAVQALLSRQIKVGADISIVAGDDDAYRAESARMLSPNDGGQDIESYSDGEGLYAGTSISGTLIDLKMDWNDQFYHQITNPAEIARIEDPINLAAARLMDKLATL